MTTKLLALATALVAATVFTSSAEAGGGVRLGFGFPLGSFTATPAQGGGGDYASAPRRTKEAKRKAPAPVVREATRAPDKAEPVKSASAEAPSTTNEVPATSAASESTGTPALTGSTALIQQATPVEPDTAAAPASKDAPSTVASAEKTTAVSDAAEACKKFIPSIGATVSVGCAK